MKNSLIARTSGIGEEISPTPGSRKSGFTLVEVMFASAIALFLFLTMLETLSVCRRIAADVKWRLAADAIAYDAAWAMFNQQTAWFDTQFPLAKAQWESVPAEQTSVWYGGGTASLFWSVTPVGVPTTKWIITANVQWPVAGNKFAKLPKDYVIERHRADRNLFRATN
jgi:type II secretory pathway pseudopilin PulG